MPKWWSKDSSARVHETCLWSSRPYFFAHVTNSIQVCLAPCVTCTYQRLSHKLIFAGVLSDENITRRKFNRRKFLQTKTSRSTVAGWTTCKMLPFSSGPCANYVMLTWEIPGPSQLQLSVSEAGEPGYEYFNNLHDAALSMQKFFSDCAQSLYDSLSRYISYQYTVYHGRLCLHHLKYLRFCSNTITHNSKLYFIVWLKWHSLDFEVSSNVNLWDS